MLFGVKEIEQFDLTCNNITVKNSSHERPLGITIDKHDPLMSILLISAKQLTKNSTLSVE